MAKRKAENKLKTLPRERDWPASERVPRLLALVRSADAEANEAVIRGVLVERPEAEGKIWRPCFIRIDIARRGDAPPVEPDDLGTVRVIVEKTSVADVTRRLERFFDDDGGAKSHFDFDGEPVLRPLGTGWHHSWEASQGARRWGCFQPIDIARSVIPDPAPWPSGQLEGKRYGVLPDLHELLRRVTGADYSGDGDGRFNSAHIVVPNYRARLTRTYISSGRLHFEAVPPNDVLLRVRGVFRPGKGVLDPIRAPGNEDVPMPSTSRTAELELLADDDPHPLDKRLVEPTRGVALPDGTKMPEGEAAALLRAFHPHRIHFARPIGETLLHDTLKRHRSGPATRAELECVLRVLLEDCLIEEVSHPGPLFKSIDLPGLPKMTAPTLMGRPRLMIAATTPRLLG